eukprot:CAMPEP_0197235430 /NCGR_PEP_ID=MMETSP1429-20130617/2859_1 /TAXON_ID=49237 /ORGANISM="Chaetoceros  sp., Strain UNC1202" /LENGTH=431 /DNA_ID=CAMNT_0042694011 /DNA_START=44 /DNA_END=1339 /DNA_ORIENTATION=-
MTEESKMEVEAADANTPKPKKDENVTPSASGESAAKYPDMELAQSIHRAVLMTGPNAKLTSEALASVKISPDISSDVIKRVKEMENPSLYSHLSPLLQWDQSPDALSSDAVAEMMKKNEETMKTLEGKVEEAKENAGDMEVLDARFEIARFAAKSMNKDEALGAYKTVLDLPKLSSGKQMDALMESARIASFYGDVAKNAEFVKKIAKLAEESGDWDRRNRLKVYNALCKLLARDVKGAASLLIDCIATFSCTEVCSFKDFIVYTMLSNLLYLPRTDLKSKIIDGPEILGVKQDISAVFNLVSALHDCDYKGYLHAVVEVEAVLLADRYLQPHCGYIMRELHVLGYKQFLDSYKSVTLESMARSFGISIDFLDAQISRFIAAGRLTAKIDKFGGVVETNRPDLKNAQYRDMIQKGDLLLNRIQKLARVVDA